jgi:WD40 repeat protein
MTSSCSGMSLGWSPPGSSLLRFVKGWQCCGVLVRIGVGDLGRGVGSSDTTLKIWNTGTQRVLHTLYEHQDYVKALAYARQSGQLASAGLDRDVLLWDLETGQKTVSGPSQPPFPVPAPPRRPAANAGGGQGRGGSGWRCRTRWGRHHARGTAILCIVWARTLRAHS